ncbi:MAG: glutathione S-transferase family protein [Gammaproteobacteria bacterium]|nr:glutathione S-transferase family protein [Gammaproteobacteria bacterium]
MTNPPGFQNTTQIGVTEQSNSSGIVLYFHPGTRAVRPRWLLEELGVSYDLVLVNLGEGEHKRRPYLAINPAAKVPALTDGEITLTESLAICMHLADRFQEKNLAPAAGTIDRACYYKWMAYSVGTLEPAILEKIRRQKTESEGGKYVTLSQAMTEFDVAVGVLETALESSQFILGDRFTAVDVMVGSLINWANNMHFIESHQHTLEWLRRLKSRPAYLRATKN